MSMAEEEHQDFIVFRKAMVHLQRILYCQYVGHLQQEKWGYCV